MEAACCLSSYLKNNDDDTFHTLIEMGDLAVECVGERFSAKTDEHEYLRLLDILQEVRTPAARGLLRTQLMQPFSRRWVMAMDAFTYSLAPEVAELDRLRSELTENDPETRSKAEVIDRILRDLA